MTSETWFVEDGRVLDENRLEVANAHSVDDLFLIAAAPELLEALRECASMLDDNYEALGYNTAPACVVRARAAIRKALEG